MYDGHMKLLAYAKDRGRWWARKYPNYYDDMISVALLTLVRVGDEVSKGYLSACIDNAAMDFVAQTATIRIPLKRLLEANKTGTSSELPVVRASDEFIAQAKGPPVWMDLYIKELLAMLQLTPRERRILDLRSQGYTLEEIGIEVGGAKNTIHDLLRGIQSRYIALSAKHGEIL